MVVGKGCNIAPDDRCLENIDGGARAIPNPCMAASIMAREESKTIPAFICAAGGTFAAANQVLHSSAL